MDRKERVRIYITSKEGTNRHYEGLIMKYLIILALLLSGCASIEQSQQERKYQALEAELNKRAELLVQDLKSGKLNELEFSQKRLALQEHYFPQSYNTLALLRDRLALSSALDRGDISRLQFDMAWTERKRQYEANKATDEARHQQQIAQQQPGINPVQAMIMMNMINRTADRIGHSLDRQTVPVQYPTHCHSYAFGNGIDTTCY
jgi:hypothetical protein